jgi:hypothetical protein
MENVLAVDDNFEPIPIVVDSFEIKLYRPGLISATEAAVNDLQVSLFPNPGTGRFQLQTAIPYEKLFIFDAFGRVVYEEENQRRKSSKSFDLSLKPGCYFLRLEAPTGASCTKLIIE